MTNWFITTLTEGKWYDQVYLYSIIICLACFVLFLIFIVPFSEINDKINREYRALCSKHFFISFRKRKQNELYEKAKMNVSSRDNRYFLYQLSNISRIIGFLSFGIAFWFFIGSFVYEKIILPLPYEYDNDYSENYNDEEYDDGGYEKEDDSNIHHVESHWVEGYTRSEGTEVDGYWRGGEDGYYRSDPDDDTSNNLNSDEGFESEQDDGYEGIGAEIGEFFFGN
ncbi:hypothetical protein G6549_27575 [Bacillus sp. MM2020_1]|nr:hypothetical protein [Bacillus sp. MM2020_1]